MANFRLYPGLFVKVQVEHLPLKVGETYQVLSTRFEISFVGVNGAFSLSKLSGKLEPIYPQEQTVNTEKNKGWFW